jgi:murein DD-endopeptidase MepM/ murein hydrolase activator NlpD
LPRAGGVHRVLGLPTTAAIVCVLQFLAVEALAHVGDADPTHPAPAIEADNKQSPAKAGHVCGLPPSENRLFAGFTLAANVPGAARLPLSEVRLDSVRAAGAVYRDLLSLFEGFDAASDVVQVAEGVTPDGASCPLYVAVGSGNSRQIFWRFTPDDEPASWFDDRGRRLGDAAFAPPKPGARLSSPFGPRRYYGRASGGGFHDGIDYESKVGEPILAAADGVIELQGGHFEYGLTVKIRHAPQQVTLYAHMSRFANGMAVGAKVRKGDVIGYVGMTGRSTGAHLHFSTIVNGKFVDPAPYLSSKGDRPLSAPSMATFRKWQQEIRATVKSAPHQQRRPQGDDVDWTQRI